MRRLPLAALIAFAAFLGILVVAAGVIGAIAPLRPEARCPAARHCGTPPQLPAPLQNQTVWRSSAFLAIFVLAGLNRLPTDPHTCPVW